MPLTHKKVIKPLDSLHLVEYQISMRKRIAVIGAQAGDEGKGVRVTHYVKKAVEKSISSNENKKVLTVRWQGGANAGHTVQLNGQTYKLHQLPSGILFPGTYNLIGEGVYLNPRSLVEEITKIREMGVEISPRNLGIASNAHVTLDYHIARDAIDRNKKNHTSTGRGIRPTAMDKAGRIGIRFQEFLSAPAFESILNEKVLPHGITPEFLKEAGGVKSFIESYDEIRKFLAPFSVLQSRILKEYKNSHVIGEGAQGFKLDVDRGLYPGVTSSNPSMVPFRADVILGAVKLYESSIGHDRPFVNRIGGEMENLLRDMWGERGTTTGLPRDLGWLDIVSLKNAIDSAEVDYLVGTCGDRLEAIHKLGQKVKLVVAYKSEGKTYTEWDPSFHNRKVLYEAEPVFEEFDSWEKFIDNSGELNPNARKYIERIEELTGRQFVLQGTGPGVNDVIEVKDILE